MASIKILKKRLEIKNTQLENAYRKCWQDYVYNLKIRFVFKNLIWDYLNDSIDLEQLKIYYE